MHSGDKKTPKLANSGALGNLALGQSLESIYATAAYRAGR